MPSSYTANGGIELPADGEQSATWGGTVNDNMSIIDRLTNGVGAITLSGTTHTLTTSNGTLSDGQYNVLVLGGSPSGANTVTISPNDGQHVYIVKNGSGETATFTQGSGANVSVADGTTKIIYCDGAGSGAAVTDVTGSLDLGSLVIDGTAVTASAAELNIMDGVTATTAELNIMDGVTATTAELNIMDGVTATTAELNIMDGVTTTTAELNTLDGFTGTVDDLNYAKDLRATGVTTAEFDKLDGLTATTAELNILDGVTATTAELNYVDGVTSAIQAQIDAISAALFPAGAVIHVAQSTAPTGFLKANGDAVSRTTYSALFSAIGTTFGAGDGSTTFNVPDLRGEFVRGLDDGRGIDSGRALGSAQADEIEAHNHRIYGLAGGPIAIVGSQTRSVMGGQNTGGYTDSYSGTKHIEDTGGSETRPRNVALLACIKH
jgi:microcystin-dependent protein